MKPIHQLIYFFSILVLFSCNQKPKIDHLISCSKNHEFQHQKTIRDVKNHFEINIGDHWKRELYFDDHQSRIYAADTTRSFSSSFIIDVTRFSNRIIIEEDLKKRTTNQVLSEPNTYIIKNKVITYKNQPAYAIYYFRKINDRVIYNLQYYISYKNCYYLLSAQINGSHQFDSNNCEILQVFNSLNILP